MNKIEYIRCDCGSEILEVGAFDSDCDLFSLAIFYRGVNNKMSMTERKKYCKRVMQTGSPYADQMVINKDEAIKLAKFLIDSVNDGRKGDISDYF